MVIILIESVPSDLITAFDCFLLQDALTLKPLNWYDHFFTPAY